MPDTWWHGSKLRIDAFEVMPRTGGIHFGTREQAAMRNGAFLHEVALDIGRSVRSKDCHDWAAKIKSAKGRGAGSILYLNRYEGLSRERIEDLSARKLLDRLDGMSDRDFGRVVPEAEDSVVIWDVARISLLRVFDRAGELVWERGKPAEGQDFAL